MPVHVPIDGPLDLRRTAGALVHGAHGPTIRTAGASIARTTRTSQGPATVLLEPAEGGVSATAWGPGADEALSRVPDWVGAHDDPTSFVPDHPLLARLARQYVGVRFGRTATMAEALFPVILAQKVPGKQASQAWARIVRRYGEPAPGPTDLWVAPDPAVLADLAYFDLHPLQVEQKRADTLIRVARQMPRIAGLVRKSSAEAAEALQQIPGIGPWTAWSVVAATHGDPDAVPPGDYNLPQSIVFALTGERDGDDVHMFDLLEPFRPHRGRVVRLLQAGGPKRPRRGPRLEIVDLGDR